MSNITFSFGSGLNDSTFGKSQAPIKALIEKRAEAHEQESMLKHIYNMGKSRNFGEKYTSMTGMDGPMPVGEGAAYPVDGMQEGHSKLIEHMVWKDSFAITREAVDDSKILDLKKKPTNFVAGFYRVREEFGAAMLGGGVLGDKINFRGRTFDTTAADGKALFDTAHPAKGKGKAQSNKFAGEFSVENLGLLETRMQNFTGDNGEILAVAPNTIIIPNDAVLKNEVLSAIGADKSPDTSNNGFNYLFGRHRLIVWPYLNKLLTEGMKPWILLDSKYNEMYDCAVWLKRVELEIKSHLDTANDNNVWTGYDRFGVGFNDWRGLAVGGVTGGTAM